MKVNVYVLTEFTGCCGVEVRFIGDLFDLMNYLNKRGLEYVTDGKEVYLKNLDYEVITEVIEIRGGKNE